MHKVYHQDVKKTNGSHSRRMGWLGPMGRHEAQFSFSSHMYRLPFT